MNTTKPATTFAAATLLGAFLSITAMADTSVATDLPLGTEAAAPAETDADALAKKLANPIAAMISLPLQNNFDFGAGPDGDGFQYKLNFQPVIPVSINDDWNLITRIIIPFVSQSDVIGKTSQSGLSDTTVSMWFSPSAPTAGGWIWGVGPALLIPTGTNDFLTADQWAAGPTAIVLKQTKKFTYGALVNQLWSFSGGDGYPDVNQIFIQPFFAYLPGGGWTVALNTEATYNFTSSEWTLPVNLQLNKMIKIGKLPAQWQVGARYYAEAPDNGPDWGLRCSLIFLLPRS